MGMEVDVNKGGVKSDINVVPLVDIVLVLLIIFIVITPAISDAVVLPLSKQSFRPDLDPSSKYLSLILTRERDIDPETGLYKMADVLVDDPEAKEKFRFDNAEQRAKLLAFVERNVAGLYGDKRVFIKADAELPFYYVNELFQICREAGADEASVVTSEDKGAEREREQP